MKTDRELLELAAKAAGMQIHVWGLNGEENFAEMPSAKRWNPLTDDGDALRLAVKINKVRVYIYEDEVSMGMLGIIEKHDGDPCAATRRAIVRAAAAIGESMP